MLLRSTCTLLSNRPVRCSAWLCRSRRKSGWYGFQYDRMKDVRVYLFWYVRNYLDNTFTSMLANQCHKTRYWYSKLCLRKENYSNRNISEDSMANVYSRFASAFCIYVQKPQYWPSVSNYITRYVLLAFSYNKNNIWYFYTHCFRPGSVTAGVGKTGAVCKHGQIVTGAVILWAYASWCALTAQDI